MPRKYRPVPEHYFRSDPKYASKLIGKFINNLMYDGKKTIAQDIFYSALEIIKERFKDKDPLDIFMQALENVKPQLETKSRRVGGATYQVPVQVKPKRQVSLAMKWIINSARAKKGRPMYQKLADELILAYKKEGDAIKKRIDTHKMAESNRAFAHLAY
jgi:small subunit ribosomal protein S7